MPDITFQPARLSFPPVYVEVALSECDPKRYTTETVRVLANPSWRIRREFHAAVYGDAALAIDNAWTSLCSLILDKATYDELKDTIEDMDPAVVIWLLLPRYKEDPNVKNKVTAINPYVFTVWDDYRDTLSKALASP